MTRITYHTSESVTEGHPDKVADQISDAILDAMLTQDSESRVACETFVTTGLTLIGGEISTESYVDLQRIVRDTIEDIGYIFPDMGFYYRDIAVINMIHEQSPDIAQGVVKKSIEEQGAGDQGLMFGYATDHTDEYMPLPLHLSHQLTKNLAKLRKSGKLSYLRPDGKSQVAVKYEDGQPVAVPNVTIAAQHTDDISLEKIREDLLDMLIIPIIGDYYDKINTNVTINGTGKFVIGGPHGDTGLTGRKIIVDTYGGMGSHGGGAFSGKDPSKVDRSGSYVARYIAKNIVGSGMAKECEVQIAYTIGVPEPFSFNVDTFGTGSISDEEIKQKVLSNIDLRPGLVIQRLDLKRPIYRQTAAYGHFGRNDLDLSWEKLDLF
ncbi:MAG: methionine adenosyltransferase [Candidatus Heimdallarchaeota archaeon]|nr:methionine adenosyltransferase [Candidatus Heimdallarchaeota archaeon]MDH5647202.1 methionine adenosyltransferase [Candidatus Heimdallarchaeota archaeon]